ncbi:MAG: Ig-like domain-containing protein, partial [Pontixanthobacter sp.]
MSDELCQRQISFAIGNGPNLNITATEDGGGNLIFKVDVDNSTGTTADLRALFFDMPDSKLAGLTVSGGDGYLTEARVQKDHVIDLDDGANLSGKVKNMFDVGLEWGTAGSKDNIDFEVSFVLSNAAHNLTLDDIAYQRFGAKLDAIGGGSGKGGSSSKLLGTAPAAPDANADAYAIYEDGAAGFDSPSKTPVGTTFQVLSNDTDADPNTQLQVTHVDGAEHGTVTIAADGQSVIYTPFTDYAGTDSFEYCISDGQGGQDSAVVTVEVRPVADNPVIAVSASAGATVNDTVLHVTARADDADGSETINGIAFTNAGDMPAGATVTATGPMTVVNGVAEQTFLVSTAAGQDYNFTPTFTSTATEAANGDTQTATAGKKIEINFTHNEGSVTFDAESQSMWDSGDALVFKHDQFHGITIDKGGSATFSIAGETVVSAGYTAFLQVGLDIDFEINGGTIDAQLPVDVTVDSTWNKTSDQLYLSSSALISGGSFVTQSPYAHLFLEFIAKGELSAYVDVVALDEISAGGGFDFSQVLVDADSDQLNFDFPFGGGAGNLNLAWPNLSVTNDPGTLEG